MPGISALKALAHSPSHSEQDSVEQGLDGAVATPDRIWVAEGCYTDTLDRVGMPERLQSSAEKLTPSEAVSASLGLADV